MYLIVYEDSTTTICDLQTDDIDKIKDMINSDDVITIYGIYKFDDGKFKYIDSDDLKIYPIDMI